MQADGSNGVMCDADCSCGGLSPAQAPCDRQMRADRVRDWLASGGLRPTRQRILLADLLHGDGQHRHVTAESLHLAAQSRAVQRSEAVSLATVYNTLRAFCRAGLINEVSVDSTRSYFDTRIDDHAHFYWEDTAELSDAPHGAVQIAALPEAPEGTEISRVDVVIRLRRS